MNPGEINLEGVQRGQIYLVTVAEGAGIVAGNANINYLATVGLFDCVGLVMVRPNEVCVLSHIPGEIRGKPQEQQNYIDACLRIYNDMLGSQYTLANFESQEDDGSMTADYNYILLVATGVDKQYNNPNSLLRQLSDTLKIKELYIYESNNIVVKTVDNTEMFLYKKQALYNIPEEGNGVPDRAFSFAD